MNPAGPAIARIVDDEALRIGEDRILRFKVTLDDDVTVPEDLADWNFRWELRPRKDSPESKINRTTGAGITVVMDNDPDAEEPTPIEMVNVFIPRAQSSTLAQGRYFHALWRTDPNLFTALSEGDLDAVFSAVR